MESGTAKLEQSSSCSVGTLSWVVEPQSLLYTSESSEPRPCLSSWLMAPTPWGGNLSGFQAASSFPGLVEGTGLVGIQEAGLASSPPGYIDLPVSLHWLLNSLG